MRVSLLLVDGCDVTIGAVEGKRALLLTAQMDIELLIALEVHFQEREFVG